MRLSGTKNVVSQNVNENVGTSRTDGILESRSVNKGGGSRPARGRRPTGTTGTTGTDPRKARVDRVRRLATAMASTTTTTTRVVVVGDVIAERGRAGAGAYADDAGRVRASACGRAVTEGDGARAVSSVRTAAGEAVVPRIGDDVYGRVTRVDDKAASVAVSVVRGRAPADGAFVGTIRRQDARAHAVDAVVMDECFREGDVVRAEVLSLGDSRSFYLTTAKDELGVVRATHRESRKTMLPISWTEVQCPVTGEVEDRKVARVDE